MTKATVDLINKAFQKMIADSKSVQAKNIASESRRFLATVQSFLF